MSEFKLLNFPVDSGSVADGLRRLADDIDQGKYKAAHNLVWVLDTGDGDIEFNLLGHAHEPGPTAYFLLALAQHSFISQTLAIGPK